MTDVERYLFRKAERPSENLRELLGTFMQLQQLKKESSQQAWEREYKERELTGKEKKWGAEIEWLQRRPGTTRPPDITTTGGWSPDFVQSALDHYGMDIQTFTGYSPSEQGKLLTKYAEAKHKETKESGELDLKNTLTLIGDVDDKIKAYEKNAPFLSDEQIKDHQRLNEIRIGMMKILQSPRINWKNIMPLYEEAFKTDAEFKETGIKNIQGYPVVGSISEEEAQTTYAKRPLKELPDGRILVETEEKKYLLVRRNE